MSEILVYNARPEFPFSRKTSGASGFDLCANLGAKREISPGRRWIIGTGIHLAMPLGIEAQVRPRSGLARDHGVVTILGTVDADYRGEIMVTLINHGQLEFQVHPGDRIAQLVFAPVLLPDAAEETITRNGWRVVIASGVEQLRHVRLRAVDALDQLPPSDRGAAGFGSTGVR